MYRDVCLHVSVCTTCMLGTQGSQKRASDPLEVALQTFLLAVMYVLRTEPRQVFLTLDPLLLPLETVIKVTLLSIAVPSLMGHQKEIFLHRQLEADPERERKHLLLYTLLASWTSNLHRAH